MYRHQPATGRTRTRPPLIARAAPADADLPRRNAIVLGAAVVLLGAAASLAQSRPDAKVTGAAAHAGGGDGNGVAHRVTHDSTRTASR